MVAKRAMWIFGIVCFLSMFAFSAEQDMQGQEAGQEVESTQASANEQGDNPKEEAEEQSRFDKDGYDENGYNEDGYDRDGYDLSGFKQIIQPKKDAAYFKYRKEIPFLYEKCHNRDFQSCLKYASYYENGKGVVQNFSIAEYQYKILCAHSSNTQIKNKACTSLENLYAKQLGIESLYKKGLPALQAACNKGEGKACAIAGVMLEKNMRKNVSAILNTYKKGCAKDNALACYKLGVMNKQGIGVAKSDLVAVEFLFQACKLDKYYCDELEDMSGELLWYKESKNLTDEDVEKAIGGSDGGYWEACRGGNNSLSCTRLEDDCFAQARACEMDDPLGCAWLAGLIGDGMCNKVYDSYESSDYYLKKARELGKRDTTYN